MVNGDFISLSLENSVPVFKFNLGHGTTIISGDRPLQLGKWHTIEVNRWKKQGNFKITDPTIIFSNVF